MSDYVEHEEQYKGCRIRLMVDQDGDVSEHSNPRKMNPVGEMVYSSSRYVLGDRRVDSWERFFADLIPEKRLQQIIDEKSEAARKEAGVEPEDEEAWREWDLSLSAKIREIECDYGYPSENLPREELRALAEENNLLVPVYAHIHGGTELSTGRGIVTCQWDSGQCGFIWCSLAKAKYEFGSECTGWDDLCENPEYKSGSDLPEKITLRKRTEDFLNREVAEYNSWCNNRIVYFVTDYLEDPEGDPDNDDYTEIERVCGFLEDASAPYGKEYARALEEARSSVDHFLGEFSTWEEKRAANCVGGSI